jgi:hypothetical protein
MKLEEIIKITGGPVITESKSNMKNIFVMAIVIVGAIYLYTNVKKMYKGLEVRSENSKTKK